MKNCGLLLTVICGLGLVGGCGGGGSSMSLVTTHPVSPLVITSSAPPAGTAGTAYGGSGSFMFSASGGVAPYSWSWAAVSGSSLPSGLNLTSSGEISGTPTTAGTYNVTVTVTDSEVPPTKTSANYSIMIASPVAPLQITSGDPVQGQVGVVYGTAHRLRDNFGRFVTLTFFQLTSTGGNGSITWTWAAGASVPPGLSCCVRFFPTGPFPLREGIFVRGEISGLPTTPGKFNVVVTATDSSSPPLTATGN